MTKFYVTVCLPPQPTADVSDAVGEALAPYDINLDEDHNPVGEWDWWHIRGDLPVRPEYADNRLLIHDPTHVNGQPRLRRPLRCDGGPKRMLDFPAMRAAAAEYARARWHAWHSLAVRYPRAEPLSDLLARYADPGKARRRHLAQPLVQEVVQRAARGDEYFTPVFLVEDPVAHFDQVEEDDYVEQAVQDAYLTYALVTVDGRWIDRYRIDNDQANLPAYRRFRASYLDDLDDDAVIVDVLCHC